jgi:hypothetical protein
MRTVRSAAFDCVLVHDAIGYMASRADLAAAFATAFAHTAPGGAALFQPDFVSETFTPGTDTGGSDAGGRGLRYLEWRWLPDSRPGVYVTDVAYLLRDETGAVEVLQDRHVMGLFPRAAWLELIAQAGFQARAVPFEPGSEGGVERDLEVFVGLRPDSGEGGLTRWQSSRRASGRSSSRSTRPCRAGAGNRACAARALALCRDLPPPSRGARPRLRRRGQTLHLAELTAGAIVAVDSHAPSVVAAPGGRGGARPPGPGSSRWSRHCPLPAGPRALRPRLVRGRAVQPRPRLRPAGLPRLLRPGGHLAFSDAVWRKADPPPEVQASFDLDTPARGTVADDLAAIGRSGLSLLGHFTLPDEAWWDDFYTPMERRIGELRGKYAGDLEALAVLDQLAREPEMHRRARTTTPTSSSWRAGRPDGLSRVRTRRGSPPPEGRWRGGDSPTARSRAGRCPRAREWTG